MIKMIKTHLMFFLSFWYVVYKFIMYTTSGLTYLCLFVLCPGQRWTIRILIILIILKHHTYCYQYNVHNIQWVRLNECAIAFIAVFDKIKILFFSFK